MEEEIKNLLNCGYYDDCHNYIVELNEEKMKDFFKVFFKADIVTLKNTDMDKMKKENQDLKEKFDYMMEVHKRECEEMKHCVDEAAHYADERRTNYIPKIGQRVFIDMPVDYYKVFCRVRAKQIKDNVEGNTDTLQKIYNNLIKEYNKNEPFIIKI